MPLPLASSLRVLFVLPCALGLAAPGQAAVIELAKYTFTGATSPGNRTSSDTDANSTASLFNRGGASTGPSINATAGAAWILTPDATSEAEALSRGHYFAFSVTPVSGHELDLAGLSLRTSGSSLSTGGGFSIYYSLGGSVYSPLLGATAYRPRTGSVLFGTSTVDLSGAEFQNLTSAITFRLYGWDDGPTNNKGYFDDVVLTGAAVPVTPASAAPEPPGLALVAGALACLGLLRRRSPKKLKERHAV